tara:strand:- start:6294 stop:6731 length:438 start_codon:yes stop_codon:yes gene_type:complete
MLGLSVVYYSLNFILIFSGLLESESELMVSLLILPILVILKDANKILEPLTVIVKISEDEISVSRGLITRVIDKLEFKTVDNAEVVETLGGKLFGHATIRLYAPGGSVEIPFLYDYEFFLDDFKQRKQTLIQPPKKQLLDSQNKD